jgi:hypothetical protein
MFSATSDTTLYAVWKPIVDTLKLSTNPINGGTVLGAGNYNKFSEITVRARPNVGYNFVNWMLNDEAVSLDTAYTFTITGNLSLVAHFELKTYTITYHANGGTGTMNPETFTHGISQKLSSNVFAKAGNSFAGWARTTIGNVVLTDTAMFTATSDTVLYAVWQPIIHTITLSASPSHAGTVSGGGNHNEGTKITKVATPNFGYRFVSWTEADTIVTTENTYTLTVTRSRVFVANFTEVSSIKPSNKEQDVKLYPNPVVNGELIIDNGQLPIESVQIYDTKGKLMYQQSSIVNYRLSIDISHLPNGIYVVKIGNHSIRIVKQ